MLYVMHRRKKLELHKKNGKIMALRYIDRLIVASTPWIRKQCFDSNIVNIPVNIPVPKACNVIFFISSAFKNILIPISQ